jgi:hypothetical protein
MHSNGTNIDDVRRQPTYKFQYGGHPTGNSFNSGYMIDRNKIPRGNDAKEAKSDVELYVLIVSLLNEFDGKVEGHHTPLKTSFQ